MNLGNTLRSVVIIYFAFALVWLGIQIPVRLDGCRGFFCIIDVAISPVRAAVWPLDALFSDFLKDLPVQILLFFVLPLLLALLLVRAWNDRLTARAAYSQRGD